MECYVIRLLCYFSATETATIRAVQRVVYLCNFRRIKKKLDKISKYKTNFFSNMPPQDCKQQDFEDNYEITNHIEKEMSNISEETSQ